MYSALVVILLVAGTVCQPTPSDHCQVYNSTYGVCTQCLPTYYLSIYFCLPCSPLCQCTNSSNFCQQCITVNKTNYNLSTYYDSVANRCWYCDEYMPYCATCSQPNICTSCYGGRLIDSATSQCSNNTCTPNCQICKNQTGCLVCQLGFFLNEQTGLCGSTSCMDNCAICKDASTCQLCSPSYYVNDTTNVCTSCVTDCILCTNSTDCISCIPGYGFQNGSCQDTGMSNCILYSDDFSVCLSCQPNYYVEGGSCSQCSGCLLCTQPFICLTQCQSGFNQFFYSCNPLFSSRILLMLVLVVIFI